MANTKKSGAKKIKYSEPKSYFSKEIMDKYFNKKSTKKK